MDIREIIINKNRGWRGLAEIQCRNSEDNNEIKTIFSFSQQVWDDMLDGYIVVQDDTNYIILEFNNLDALPRADQQRSVLIKNFRARVINQWVVEKSTWNGKTNGKLWAVINNYIKNRNNHTQSDWNCIGIRVVPMI